MTNSENPYQATVYERRPEERPLGARLNIGVWRQRMAWLTVISLTVVIALSTGRSSSPALKLSQGLWSRLEPIELAIIAIWLVCAAAAMAWLVLGFWERRAESNTPWADMMNWPARD